MYEDGKVTELGELGGGATAARAMNNLGHVVGDSALPNAAGQRAYVYRNGQLTNLGTLGGNYSVAEGINDYGQIVGFAHRAGAVIGTAFLYENGKMIDLGTLGGDSSSARDINNHGQIVGTSNTDGRGLRAFIYENGHMTDLGTLGGPRSGANAINELGQIVGNSWTEPYPTDIFGFLWENGVMHKLQDLVPPDSGWYLRYASDINDAGWIVGSGFNPQGQARAFLLTPIPEPTALTCIVGFALLARRRSWINSPSACQYG